EGYADEAARRRSNPVEFNADDRFELRTIETDVAVSAVNVFESPRFYSQNSKIGGLIHEPTEAELCSRNPGAFYRNSFPGTKSTLQTQRPGHASCGTGRLRLHVCRSQEQRSKTDDEFSDRRYERRRPRWRRT